MIMCPARRRLLRFFGVDEEAVQWDRMLALLDDRHAELERTVDAKERELGDER